jgi:acetoin utilization deacetylase AcuC-like enzyme
LTEVPFLEATDEQLLKVHTPDYLQKLKQLDATGGNAGRYAHIGVSGLRIVRLAAGAAIFAADAIVKGDVKAFARLLFDSSSASATIATP